MFLTFGGKSERLFKIYDLLVSFNSQPVRMEREEDHLRSKKIPHLMKTMQNKKSAIVISLFAPLRKSRPTPRSPTP